MPGTGLGPEATVVNNANEIPVLSLGGYIAMRKTDYK